MRWYWDPEARLYRDAETGRILTRQEVMQYVEASIDASQDRLAELTALLVAGRLSQADFNDLVRAEIQQEYIRQAMIGAGGREQMTAADWAALGTMLLGVSAFLGAFLAEIATGGLSEEAITARLDMYANSAREAYWSQSAENARELGMDEERWHLGQVATEHCEDCVAYHDMAWQPIGTFPQPGDGTTQCLTNCACSKSFRNSVTGETY